MANRTACAHKFNGDDCLSYELDVSENCNADHRQWRQPQRTSMYEFASFGIRQELVKAIADRGFVAPSLVQMDTLPEALAGKDLLCQSKTGSGKTAIFVLSSLNMMEFSDAIETLVVVPTRELAVQTVREYELFGKYLNNCRWVRHLIFDECDKLLAERSWMAKDVRYILSKCPEDRQIQMYTATISKCEAERERDFLKLMHTPKLMLVSKQYELILKSLLQYRVTIKHERQKTRTLIDLLEKIDFNQVAIFVNTVDRCCALAEILEDQHYSALPLHSNMSQNERLDNFGKFKDFRRRIVVATDLMGRGIDVEFVTFVINYDVPKNNHIYLHRVGRTGRMGRRALAVSICASEQDVAILENIQHTYGVTLDELPNDLDPEIYIDYST